MDYMERVSRREFFLHGLLHCKDICYTVTALCNMAQCACKAAKGT